MNEEIACKKFVDNVNFFKGTRPFVNTIASINGALRIIECLRASHVDDLAIDFVQQISELELASQPDLKERISNVRDQLVLNSDEVRYEQSNVDNSLPPIWIRGMNFAGAMLRWSASGLPRRTQAEIDERLAICRDCPHLVENHCNLCGCPCVESNQLLNKLALATESCPLGKWK